ncbi:hypothetical protein PPYR_04386 [Photinus pyralis]|uniref:EB domain-containing protein n=1 Tax=Photinus pyralis TaxID=7054 RepID=A0A1Y1JY43_PHOPY|nr:uncharacterized protein LOC116163791 [Photinus pyralis]KAB0802200.1 hypothetical protein PPYR_04386 [Photinus pyralis]
MSKCWLRVILQGLLLLRALLAAEDLTTRHPDMVGRGDKMYDDRCNSTNDCGFWGSVCAAMGRCHCSPEYPISNHLDKCGKSARVNESCTFNEQCEYLNSVTTCRDGLCTCKFDRQPIIHPDGRSECIVIENTSNDEFVAPTMIGILVAMAVMFIIICIVFRLFSNARWRENRTIFNTPNPRLMNVSLLRDSKILHQERRSSRGSIRGPSRPPSMPSLAPHSPGSKGSHGSVDSPRSNKSSPGHINSGSAATTPMLESVTVEVRNP